MTKDASFSFHVDHHTWSCNYVLIRQEGVYHTLFMNVYTKRYLHIKGAASQSFCTAQWMIPESQQGDEIFKQNKKKLKYI